MAIFNLTGEQLAAFTTVFFIITLGFLLQRIRPFSEETLSQFSRLVVNILLPIYLFYTTATGTILAAIRIAPLLVFAGLLIPLISLLLAIILNRFAHVNMQQQPTFRFSAMVGNTSFLGIPICVGLFGASGAIYAVLYDFGTTLVAFTIGVWILSKERQTNFRALFTHPLILSVIAGVLWAFTGWKFPDWFARPCAALGDATLPLALLVGGAQIGNIKATIGEQWRPVITLSAIRLVLVPIIVMTITHIVSFEGLFAAVVVVESAMPVGLTTVIMARSHGVDPDLAATSILWSTVAMFIMLPILARMVL